MKIINIYFTCDVDPDDANVSGDRTRLSWRGVGELDWICRVLSAQDIVLTCFVRCDTQIRDAYGSHLALLDLHRRVWDELLAAGGELGWHPHLNVLEGAYYRPIRDPAACTLSLRESWEEINEAGVSFRCVRLGEAWHSTATMCELDSFGLAVDSTAVPGRARDDSLRCFDWAPTPNHPYHPSRSDYRVACNAEALQLIEVPMTTMDVRADYDSAPLRRYLDPTYHPRLFQHALEGHLSSLVGREHHLVLVFHPDELLPRPANGLHAYGRESFVANLDILLKCLDRFGHGYRFRRLGEAAA